jgi:hypothetical protein
MRVVADILALAVIDALMTAFKLAQRLWEPLVSPQRLVGSNPATSDANVKGLQISETG